MRSFEGKAAAITGGRAVDPTSRRSALVATVARRVRTGGTPP
ncbi:MAG: hypothetical protein ACO1PB_18490 [Ramlibacter sp.]